MADLSIFIKDINGKVLASKSAPDFVDLVYEGEYKEGDTIVIDSDVWNKHFNIQIDDALSSAFVFAKGTIVYDIPFGEKRVSMSPKVFTGNKHYIYAEVASDEDVKAYRNLALNSTDQHKDVNAYPHATANVETRGESVFAAKNAIDGVRANLSHGEWPFASWGINRQDDAELTLDFGRKIITDKIVLYTRSDFPHDNWWINGRISFSDGTSMEIPMGKSERAHVFSFAAKEIEWLKLGDLIKADDPSPFPALTQIEVYGQVKM